MRLNKFISSTGFCSRREADKLIDAGRVKINGKPTELGLKVEQDDQVTVDGELLVQKTDDVYILLNKPVGITCTTESHIEGNIIDFVNHRERIFPVGRLDKDSEGLIILTSDGDIVNKILREEYDHKKEYMVTVDKAITTKFLRGMSQGVKIYNPVKNEHTQTKRCEVEKIDDKTFKITLSQGLNRQIRRMCSAFDYRVVKLRRIKIMNLTLEGLKTGKWRNLTPSEVSALKE